MGLELAFQITVGGLAFIGGTPIALSVLSENPFDKYSPRAYIHRWMNDVKDEKDPRNQPFSLHLGLALFLHVIAMIFFCVAFFSFYHNSGANDGFETHPLSLIALIASYCLYTAWVVVYLGMKGNSNVLFVQLIALFITVVAFFEMLSVHHLHTRSWWITPYFVWQLFLTIKIAWEHGWRDK